MSEQDVSKEPQNPSLNAGKLFEQFVLVIAKLRDPVGGCPWDLEQTHKSIRPYLLEEAYEVLEAIDEEDDAEFVKELGDLLLQVVLHAQIARDRRAFSIEDVLTTVSEKIITRHPHVFGEVKAANPLEASKSWERQKLKEKPEGHSDIFGGIPDILPALLRAHRMGEKACHVGFDWKSIRDVLAKVDEELEELKEEITNSQLPAASSPISSTNSIQTKHILALEHEVGDLLFSVVQLARWLGLSPEDCLRNCCVRFGERFREMKNFIDQPLEQLPIEALEEAWQKAKNSLK